MNSDYTNNITNWKQSSSGYDIFLNLSLASSLIITTLGIIVSSLVMHLFRNYQPLIKYGIPFLIILPSILLLISLLHLLLSLWRVVPKNRSIETFYIRLFFALTSILRPMVRIETLPLQRSFISLNNRLVSHTITPTDENAMLILVPHCLQDPDCPYKVTGDITECRACGKCEMGRFREINQNSSITVEVVPGGTLAREIIYENNPRVIVAVACERELALGIMDTLPHQVVGIINERPSGYCKNTCVDMGFVEWMIEYIKTGLFRGVNYSEK